MKAGDEGRKGLSGMLECLIQNFIEKSSINIVLEPENRLPENSKSRGKLVIMSREKYFGLEI